MKLTGPIMMPALLMRISGEGVRELKGASTSVLDVMSTLWWVALVRGKVETDWAVAWSFDSVRPMRIMEEMFASAKDWVMRAPIL